VLPQPQPANGWTLNLYIDDKEMGKLEQGQTSDWSLEPGPHRVEVGHVGVEGFVAKMFGSQKAIMTQTINVPNGSTVKYEIGYKMKKCSQASNLRSRAVLFFQKAAHQPLE
jgi:hypothetical protein